jgi:hypothetical protein
MKFPTRTLPEIDIDLFHTKYRAVKGCWVWEGSKYNNGYGKFGRRGYMAHRISYELSKGKVPDNMFLDHLCRNRLCVKPAHLEPVSLVENVMRGESIFAKNARKTHCKHGHEFTAENTYVPRQFPNKRYCKACRDINSRKSRLNNLSKPEMA